MAVSIGANQSDSIRLTRITVHGAGGAAVGWAAAKTASYWTVATNYLIPAGAGLAAVIAGRAAYKHLVQFGKGKNHDEAWNGPEGGREVLVVNLGWAKWASSIVGQACEKIFPHIQPARIDEAGDSKKRCEWIQSTASNFGYAGRGMLRLIRETGGAEVKAILSGAAVSMCPLSLGITIGAKTCSILAGLTSIAAGEILQRWR